MPNGKHGYRPVPGSHRAVASGAQRIKDASPQAQVEVTLVLRRRSDSGSTPASSAPMDRAEAERVLGADPADVDKIEDFAHEHGLTVTSVDLAARSVGLVGTVAQMNAAFAVNLGEYRHADTLFRGREGDIQVPDTVAPVIRAVLGLDERQQARAHFRVAGPPSGSGAVRAHAASRSFAP